MNKKSKVLVTGATGFLGNHLIANAYTPVDELHPKKPSGLYALTKMINEETIRNYYTSHGL